MFLLLIHWSLVLSVFSFKLILRLDLAGFYHARANRIGRLWIFEIGPLLDYRLIAFIVKKVTNEVLESFFFFLITFILLLPLH